MKEIRLDILDQAADAILGDRVKQYGDPKDNFARVAKLWRAYLETNNGVITRNIDAYDVACMMTLFKIARMRNRPESHDSAVDAAGYAACAAEILEKERS